MASKYHSKKSDYNGRLFDSQLEADVARTLDLLFSARNEKERVLCWDAQVPFELIPKSKHGRAIVYRADFWVKFADGRHMIVESKGFDTAVWKLKRRLFFHLYPDVDLRVVRSPADLVAIAQE